MQFCILRTCLAWLRSKTPGGAGKSSQTPKLWSSQLHRVFWSCSSFLWSTSFATPKPFKTDQLWSSGIITRKCHRLMKKTIRCFFSRSPAPQLFLLQQTVPRLRPPVAQARPPGATSFWPGAASKRHDVSSSQALLPPAVLPQRCDLLCSPRRPARHRSICSDLSSAIQGPHAHQFPSPGSTNFS
jgi:hypothetical protein